MFIRKTTTEIWKINENDDVRIDLKYVSFYTRNKDEFRIEKYCDKIELEIIPEKYDDQLIEGQLDINDILNVSQKMWDCYHKLWNLL